MVTAPQKDIFYPSSDGEPLAESYSHLTVILMTEAVLKQYLSGHQATVLANQFMYYAQGYHVCGLPLMSWSFLMFHQVAEIIIKFGKKDKSLK